MAPKGPAGGQSWVWGVSWPRASSDFLDTARLPRPFLLEVPGFSIRPLGSLGPMRLTCGGTARLGPGAGAGWGWGT